MKSQIKTRLYWCGFAMISLMPLLLSCAAAEDTPSYWTAKFLFITVDSYKTGITSCIFLLLQGVAICLNKFYRKRDGWYHEEIKKNIYNSKNEVIGSYDTGHYNSWYVSPEDAESTTQKVRYYTGIARIALPRIFIGSCISGWIFSNHIFWEIVLWLAIVPYWIIRRVKDTADTERTIIWELMYMILLLICIIVYEF